MRKLIDELTKVWDFVPLRYSTPVANASPVELSQMILLTSELVKTCRLDRSAFGQSRGKLVLIDTDIHGYTHSKHSLSKSDCSY